MNKQRNWKELKEAFQLLGNKKARYIISTVLSNAIGSVCYNIVLAIVMQKVLDGIAGRKQELLQQAVWIALSAFAVAFIFEPIIGRIRNHCVRDSISSLRKTVFHTITTMPVREYESTEHGDLLTKITNDIETMEAIYLNHLPNLCFALIHGGIAMVLMICYNVWLGIAALTLGAIQTAVNFKISGSVKQYAEKRQESRAEMLQKVIDTLDGNADIKVSRAEPFFADGYQNKNQELKAQERMVEKKKAWIENADNFFENLNYIAVLGIGLYMVLQGNTSLGTVIAIISLQGNATYLFQNMSLFMAGLAETLPSVARVMEMTGISETETPEYKKELQDANASKEVAAVEMQELHFSYDGENEILSGLNCRIPERMLTVITGNSGEGKSTWTKVLLGFYDFSKGSYRLFGKNADRQLMKDRIAYVDQTCYLFQMSVMENVRLGRLDATDEEVMEACREADAHEFIQSLPNGYDTVLRNGENISGGQKQRVALARAFVSNKPILLLDEGTASLDSISEQKILENVIRMKEKRTIIVISHKEIWKERADMVYRLEQKKFVVG